MKEIIKYAAIYFIVVFSFGFVLGTIRVLLLVPNLGEQTAELIEAPFMVLVSFMAACFIRNLSKEKLNSNDLLLVGFLALGYLLAVELSVVLWVRELSVSEFVQSRYSIAGIAYLVSLILYSLFPYFVSKQSKVTQ
ncbi:hypothetical protein GCM10008090_10280 [Arenicella chitinivorans]|uniref:Uncharacterized protein n=1 Tax=Arenicella chitinivorans TaxID=1329800 RepID=A0A918VKE1_9GAMM|nr:hypothetical protein GCM10008090_10280 [Arenicella chitinivorans]